MSGPVDVLAVIGSGRFSVPSRLKDVIDALVFDVKVNGKSLKRSTLDFPFAIQILETQATRLAEVHAACAELIEQRDALKAALETVMGMDVKGHQLQDRLQFSDPGRAILKQAQSALARIGGES